MLKHTGYQNNGTPRGGQDDEENWEMWAFEKFLPFGWKLNYPIALIG